MIRELCRQILCHCVSQGKELVFYATGSGEISHGNVLSKEVTRPSLHFTKKILATISTLVEVGMRLMV